MRHAHLRRSAPQEANVSASVVSWTDSSQRLSPAIPQYIHRLPTCAGVPVIHICTPPSE